MAPNYWFSKFFILTHTCFQSFMWWNGKHAESASATKIWWSSPGKAFVSWISWFFPFGIPFLLQRMTNRKLCLFRRVFRGHFLKVKRQPLTSRKNDGYLLPMIKFEISSKIYNFVKLVCATRSWRLPMTQTFLMRWVRLFIFFYII